MLKAVRFAPQVTFLVASRQLSFEASANCKTLLQPRLVLKATIHPVLQNHFPSQLMIKLFKSTKVKQGNLDEKLTRKRFSPEEDQKILEIVSVHGKGRESLIEIATSLNRSIASVRSRRLKLLSYKYDASTGRKRWNYEEDKKLVEFVFKQKKIKPSNISCLMDVTQSELIEIAQDMKRSTSSLMYRWKCFIVPCLEPEIEDLATSKTLKKDVLEIVAKSNEKTTTLLGYTEEDKKFIINQVELKGDVPETWVFIAKKLGKKHPHVVQNFYYNYILQTPKVKGPFKPEEDEIILRHVKENGSTNQSFRDLAKELSRGSPESIEIRHRKLIALNEFEINAKRKAWELDEDKLLIDHVFNIKEIKAGDASSIQNMKPSEFTTVATELKRSSGSCYARWIIYIAPTLNTHLMKLPMTNDWKKDILSHIVENNIKHKKEMDIDHILREIAPGQTSRSILTYLDALRKETVNGVRKPSKLPLCDLASKRLMEQAPNNALFQANHKGEQKRLKWCEDVISYYKTLI